MATVSENLKIEIRPIPNRNGIKGFSENLEYFSQAHIIAPFVNPVSMKYETGLSKEDVDHLVENNFPYDISDTYIKGKAHEFWESSNVKVELKNSPMFLFPGKNLLDFIKYKYLLANSYIYKSEEEMLSGIKPEATHYIYDEAEAVGIKAGKLEKKNDLVTKVGKLNLKRKRDIILIILNENTENKNEDYLTVRFEDIFNSKEQALQLEQLLSKSTEDVNIEAEIKHAIQKNVLKRTKQGIFFYETNLGFTEEDVKATLLDSKNQELYLNLKTKI